MRGARPGQQLAPGSLAAKKMKRPMYAARSMAPPIMALCDASDYPILQLVKSGLTHANKSPHEIDAALSKMLGDLKPAVEKRIGALWALANIATLIGLLGTVSGLVQTFGAVAVEGLSQSDKQGILSNGIVEAMYNTAFGLGIAVTCTIAHVILHTRAKNIQHDLEGTYSRLVDLLGTPSGLVSDGGP